MMSELRWTLLILGVVFIAALAWWERIARARRAAAARRERTAAREPATDAAPRTLREPTLTLPQMRARDPLAMHELPVVEVARDLPAMPVLGPAPPDGGHARPGDEAAEPVAPGVIEFEFAGDEAPARRSGGAGRGSRRARGRAARVASEPAAGCRAAGRLAAGRAPPHRRLAPWLRRSPSPSRAVRCARRWRRRLRARPLCDLHKPDEEQRAVLSAASLTRPGTFDVETMDSQHYGGLSLFAVLPGPKPPPQAFDELVITARNLNERLCGILQDEQGSPLTAARIALLRERLSAGAPS